MTKEDIVALATTYSAVIVMEEDARRQHLEAMATYLDTHEPFAGADVIDVPDALLLLASHEALTCADVPGDTLRGCDKGP